MSLLNLPSAIFVLVPVLGAFIASQFTQQGIKLANSIILQTGLVGTLIGLVTMLGNMSDPSSIGPGLSIASLTILYALITFYIFDYDYRYTSINRLPLFVRLLFKGCNYRICLS